MHENPTKRKVSTFTETDLDKIWTYLAIKGDSDPAVLLQAVIFTSSYIFGLGG